MAILEDATFDVKISFALGPEFIESEQKTCFGADKTNTNFELGQRKAKI